MSAVEASQAFAKISAALVQEHDSAGMLVVVLDTCLEALDAHMAGILLSSRGRLELLSATSHNAAELEIQQSLADEGPCVEAHETHVGVSLTGHAAMAQRWPAFAPRLVEAGLASVHASPLRWRGNVVGALGVFRRSERPFTADEESVAQAFTDIAMLMITRAGLSETVNVTRQVESALSVRVVIEQAKGVLAETRGLSMEQAYEALLEAAREDHHHLERAARTVLRTAERPFGDPVTPDRRDG